MSDLIERQAAIDALKEHRALFCDNTPDTFSKLSYAEKSRVDELDMAIATLINLPSAQADSKELSFTHKALDTVSRQAVIDALTHEWDGMVTSVFDVVKSLPSAPQRTGRWIDYVKDGYVECPFCHSATTCNDNISDLHFCFSCGARMEGE